MSIFLFLRRFFSVSRARLYGLSHFSFSYFFSFFCVAIRTTRLMIIFGTSIVLVVALFFLPSSYTQNNSAFFFGWSRYLLLAYCCNNIQNYRTNDDLCIQYKIVVIPVMSSVDILVYMIDLYHCIRSINRWMLTSILDKAVLVFCQMNSKHYPQIFFVRTE